jgi:hypothetical protein
LGRVIKYDFRLFTRKKKTKIVKETVGKARLIPIRQIPDIEPYWKFTKNKIWICMGKEQINAKIYNYYRYIGMDLGMIQEVQTSTQHYYNVSITYDEYYPNTQHTFFGI